MAIGGDDPLFATTWVHVFEQDGGRGAVYRPETDPIPLSRRPRERLELSEDGSARVLAPGPDDRFVEQPATWSDEDDEIVVRTQAGAELRIVDRSSSRLVVQAGRAGDAR
jgi:hypothetical protein